MKKRFFLLLMVFFPIRLGLSCEAGLTLKICRPENHGLLNTIPCLVCIEAEKSQAVFGGTVVSMDGISVHQVYDTVPYVMGGDTLWVRLSKGTYTICVFTPVELQQAYVVPEHIWASDEYVVEITAHKCLVIEPEVSSAGYTGKWRIKAE